MECQFDEGEGEAQTFDEETNDPLKKKNFVCHLLSEEEAFNNSLCQVVSWYLCFSMKFLLILIKVERIGIERTSS